MSALQEYRATEAQLKGLQERFEVLKPLVKPYLELIELVQAEAKDKGLDLQDLAVAICPGLVKAGVAKASKVDGRSTRRARTVKVYINPNNGDRVETKGGNHKILKEWKQRYGGDLVESWLQ